MDAGLASDLSQQLDVIQIIKFIGALVNPLSIMPITAINI